jgi:hypothetical protein
LRVALPVIGAPGGATGFHLAQSVLAGLGEPSLIGQHALMARSPILRGVRTEALDIGAADLMKMGAFRLHLRAGGGALIVLGDGWRRRGERQQG